MVQRRAGLAETWMVRVSPAWSDCWPQYPSMRAVRKPLPALGQTLESCQLGVPVF